MLSNEYKVLLKDKFEFADLAKNPFIPELYR